MNITVGSVWLPANDGRGGPFTVTEVTPEYIRYTFTAMGGYPGVTVGQPSRRYTASNALRPETFAELMAPTTVDSPEYLARVW